MGSASRDVWMCDACGHEWLKGDKLPTHCASSKCRSRKWNKGGEQSCVSVPAEALPEREVVYDDGGA